jgi:16S rRNA (guanine966-N2)-methyltransferase
MQRIESGRLRGRRLLALPRGVAGLRPTAARVRGAIFDRLGSEVEGARVLDLFAGSGAMAIEALSRGAASATLVDSDRRVVRHLHSQLAALDLGAVTEVVRADAAQALSARPRPYDIVVVDPPFATPDVFEPLCAALTRGWLAPKAVVVCERERVRGKSPPVRWPDTLTVEASRIYGQAVVEFLRPVAADRSRS